MPWSRTSEGSLAIYGDEGEWIATCSSPAVAAHILSLANPGPVRIPKGGSRRFDKDVDAIIDTVDGHLAQQALREEVNAGWANKTPIEALQDATDSARYQSGWTTHL